MPECVYHVIAGPPPSYAPVPELPLSTLQPPAVTSNVPRRMQYALDDSDDEEEDFFPLHK